LPRLVAELVEEWSLELGPPFEPAHIALVVPARCEDGSAAVLKVNFPEPESEQEPDALACWDGAGAVRLLAREDERRALLIERCLPGTALWEVEEDEANEIAAEVLAELWRARPAGEFRPLGDEAARWAESLPVTWEAAGRPFEPALLDEAVEFLRAAAASEDAVLLHQDLHGGNVLRSARGWLVIDPKPLVGERAFDVASLLRDRRDDLARDPDAAGRIRRRLDFYSDRLGLDRKRVRGWGIAHALAWGFEGDRPLAGHIECARLLMG
jgi:streptomycin 6-kinase